jgi:ketosteroid isomerase-like protein
MGGGGRDDPVEMIEEQLRTIAAGYWAAMSREDAEVVRQPLAVEALSRRRLEQRLGLRFPRALALVARAISKVPPRSRLRQAMVHRAMQLGVEALNRRDYKAAFALYHPDAELTVFPEFAALGFEPAYRGRDARIGFHDRWNAEWGDFRFEPEELIDLGDRVVVHGHMKGSGLSSGAAVDTYWASILILSGGRVRRELAFLDRGEALKAAGLAE